MATAAGQASPEDTALDWAGAAVLAMAIVILQLAILVSAVAVLIRKRWRWLSSLTLGALGICYGAYGLFVAGASGL